MLLQSLYHSVTSHTRSFSLTYLLFWNLQPSWLLCTRWWKWEETRMLSSRCKLHLSRAQKIKMKEGPRFCLHHWLGDAIQGAHVLLAAISLLLCQCPESLILEILLIFFNIGLDWFSGVPSSLYPLLKLSPKFVAINFRMMKGLAS